MTDRQQTALVVDDSESSLAILLALLGEAGLEVLGAQSADEAIEVTEDTVPDIFLLDVMMPGTDGYGLCRLLKQEPRLSDVPVIFITSKTETHDIVKGFEVGAVDYISKPFKKEEVLARVESQLRIRSLTEDLRDANRELTRKQERLDDDLKAAAGIQRTLLPQDSGLPDRLRIAWRFQPCERVGGDIFNVLRIDERYCAVYMIDVSGHGVAGSLVTVSVTQSLQRLTGAGGSASTRGGSSGRTMEPSAVPRELDREYPIERFDRFFTMVYLLIDMQEGQVCYSNAGHLSPLLIRKEGRVEALGRGGPVVGVGEGIPYDQEAKPLRRGDRIILYTDGVWERENGRAQLYGEERLRQALLDRLPQSLDEMIGGLMDEVMAFGEQTPLRDDVSLMGIEY